MPLDQHGRRGAGVALWLLLTLLLMAVGAVAEERQHRVLLLFDEDRALPGLSVLDQSLRSHFRASLGSNIEFFAESMNVSQLRDERDDAVLREYLLNKYRNRKPDLIMAVMGPALHFLLRHGNELFPGVPIVFCGADAADLQGISLPDHVTGLLVKRVFAPTIDILLRLQPETRRIVVVGGTSAFDRHLMAEARSQFQPFEQRVTLEYLTDLSMADLLTRVSRLPGNNVVFFVTMFRDGTGRTYVPHEVVSLISAKASVPVYVSVDQYLGRGAVGGQLYTLEQHGASAAEIGVRVLQGETPARIPVRELASTANIFDARVLARWHLDEHRLPADSIIEYREPSAFDRYKSYIIGGAALLVGQAAIIAGLLFQRRRRRQAEAELRSSYERISNLGGRLVKAQDAERAHLARELHDDVCQQMAVLQIDLQMLVSKCGESALKEALADISTRAMVVGTSVRDMSHRLHPVELRVLGLPGALGILQRQLSTGRVSVTFSHESVPPSLLGEVALCLYRIAQEALSNAIRHGHADSVSVCLRGAQDSVLMTIEDNGVGFDTRVASSGLGLISMRERVEHVGGSLLVRSQPGDGTHVEVRIPHAGDGTVADERASLPPEVNDPVSGGRLDPTAA